MKRFIIKHNCPSSDLLLNVFKSILNYESIGYQLYFVTESEILQLTKGERKNAVVIYRDMIITSPYELMDCLLDLGLAKC